MDNIRLIFIDEDSFEEDPETGELQLKAESSPCYSCERTDENKCVSCIANHLLGGD